MKERPNGFLADNNIDHEGEIFDYIKELHDYLWKFVRTINPNASGDLGTLVDDSLELLILRLMPDSEIDLSDIPETKF